MTAKIASPDMVALREFIEAQITALSARLDALMESHRREHEQLAGQAIRDAAVMERRLEAANELRAQINAERGLYVSRDQLDARLTALDQRLAQVVELTNMHYTENGKRIGDLEKARANLDGRLATVTAGLIFIQVALSIASHFWR